MLEFFRDFVAPLALIVSVVALTSIVVIGTTVLVKMMLKELKKK